MASNFPVYYLPCADDMHGEQKTMSPLLPDRRSLSCQFDSDEFVTFQTKSKLPHRLLGVSVVSLFWWKPTFAGSGFNRVGLSHCSGLRVSLVKERMFLLSTFYSERSLESVKTHSSIQLCIFFHPRLLSGIALHNWLSRNILQVQKKPKNSRCSHFFTVSW